MPSSPPSRRTQDLVEYFQSMFSDLDPAVVRDLATSPELGGNEEKILEALRAMSGEGEATSPVHYDPSNMQEYEELQMFIIAAQERLGEVIGYIQGNRSVDHKKVFQEIEQDRKQAQELLKSKGPQLPRDYFKGLKNLIDDQAEIQACYESLMSAPSEATKKVDSQRTGADPAEVQRLREELHKVQKEKQALQRQVDDLLNQKDNLAAMAKAAEGASASKAQVSAKTIAAVKGFVSQSKRLIQRVRENAQEAKKALQEEQTRFQNDCEQCQGAIAQLKSGEIKEKLYKKMEKMYREEMMLRKQYYNTIQELRGNIRVFCRVRPLLKYELDAGAEQVTEFVPDEPDMIGIPDGRGGTSRFTFNKVYRPDCQQSDVFHDTLPLIDSVVDGFNVCIFAYGQTGSGKSFTMEGPSAEDVPDRGELERLRGVNRRAVDRLFEIFQERKDSEVSTVYLSVLEIYCEKVQDLLATAKDNASKDYKIRQGVHPVGEFEVPGNYVEGLTSKKVGSAEEVQGMLDRAKSNRKEGKHDMNKHSSRSHMILTLVVCTKNIATGQESFGKLNLIDLAGSERLSKTGATGQLAEEAKNINQSLTCLGKVIHDLQSGAKHVNFRDSKLTHLLQDSLGGNSKVLMFANCSPASINAQETKNTLDMASRAMKVSLGQATKNKVK